MFYSELIIGTTASGKSAYAIGAARKHKGIVLSIDSVSVYRQLNIGTAKPSEEILEEIPHYCINLTDIDNLFSAIEFRSEALRVIEYAQKEELPLFITAGSFFYLRALLTEPNPVPQTDPEIVVNLELRIEAEGLNSIYEELKRVDQITALKINRNDRYRIIRSLAVYFQTGLPVSTFIKEHNSILFKPTWLGKVTSLELDNSILQERIKGRTNEMLNNGLVEEVDAILRCGYQSTLRPLQSVGYKEVLDFLQGSISRTELPELINKSTLKLAKHQRTWIRNSLSSILH